jgi:hypothetical protein
MVAGSRRRRGMYDTTKTRVLLTTAAFAAVAAVFAGAANGRIPNEEGEVIRAQPVAVVAATVDPLASSRLTGLLSSLSPQEGSYLKSMSAVCSVVLCQPDEWLAARLGFATRADSAPTLKFPECSFVPCQFDEWLAARVGFATASSVPTHKFPPGYRGLP